MVELDAAQTVELNDDMTVVVYAHQHTFSTLELAGHDTDVAAFLAFKHLGVDVGQGVFIVYDHSHEAIHFAVGYCDGSTPLAIMQLITSVLHIVQFIGILFLQLGQLALVGLYDNEVDDGGYELSAWVAFFIVTDSPLHRDEVIDAQHVKEGLHTEDFLGTWVIDTQGEPMELESQFAVCTGGSCRL